MKTCIAIAFFGLVVSARAQQNVVDFRNGGITFPTQADRFVYRDQVGGSLLVGSNYVAGLWFVPGDDPASVDGRISPDRGRQAGRTFMFRNQVTTAPGTWLVFPVGTSLFTLDGVDSGAVSTLQVRVWDRARFATFGEAFAAGEYGASVPFAYTMPAPGSDASSYYMDNLRAFSLGSQGRSLSIEDIVVAEGSNGIVHANFTLSLTQAQPNPVSVDYATQDGTAIAGEDYVATNGTVVFAPGEIAKVVSITVTADAPPEDDETFYLNLSNPVNGLLTRAQAKCTITEVRIIGLSVDTSVSFNTVLNHRYLVERTSNSIDWEPVPGATNVLGTGEVLSIIDRGSGCESMRAYRARLISD